MSPHTNTLKSGHTDNLVPSKSTPITAFYANKSIFITGATGFIGKVLVEKLLHSCPDIAKIFILLRSKNGHTSKQRLEEFVTSSFFTACGRIDNKLLREKIVAVVGDITVPSLGLSDEDREALKKEVSIVFHAAASVKFDDPLKECLDFNVLGTKSVMDLCQELDHLDAFVHVSTAYAYCSRPETDEVIYPMQTSPEQMLEAAKWMDRDTLASLKHTIFEDRPNTYTFTKALAEHYVQDKKGDLPVAIARPSIVTATWMEPVAGWVDSINGPGGASLLGSLGIARTMNFKPKNKADLIPVDIVANALIAIAWYTGTSGAGKLKIYNITSGNTNPISWQQYLEWGREAAIKVPSIRVVRPPAVVMQGEGISKFQNFMTKWVSEMLFAYFVDMIMIILGHKTIMVRLVKRMHHAFDLLGYFARREWSFPTNNLLALIDKMSTEDQQTFKMDVRDVDWHAYCADFYMGIRRYLLKEDDTNIEKARKRMKMVNLGYTCIQILMFVVIALLLMYSPVWSMCRWPITTTYNAVSWTATTLCSKYVLV